MAELSPQAQAVLDAVVNCSHPRLAGMGARKDQYRRIMAPTAAAALRAAVRQVKTDENLKRHYAAVLSEMLVIDKILDIAAELESQ